MDESRPSSPCHWGAQLTPNRDQHTCNLCTFHFSWVSGHESHFCSWHMREAYQHTRMLSRQSNCLLNNDSTADWVHHDEARSFNCVTKHFSSPFCASVLFFRDILGFLFIWFGWLSTISQLAMPSLLTDGPRGTTPQGSRVAQRKFNGMHCPSAFICCRDHSFSYTA